jgi:hypothetical protein
MSEIKELFEMKSIPQIEKHINELLDKYEKCRDKDPIMLRVKRLEILAYIGGIQFVLNKKDRLSISDKTRERLLKAIKEYRDGQGK